MSSIIMNTQNALQGLMEKANSSPLTSLRLRDWDKTIEWQVEDTSFFWNSDGTRFLVCEPGKADIVLKLTKETLTRLVNGTLPFFIGLWGTGDVKFEGSFSDAYRLGYVFISDMRQNKVIFISHCWLNLNTRFPEGSAFPGANVPLIQTLLESGLGIIQMPCPEYHCIGLEKWSYGELNDSELRACFRDQALTVFTQIKDYRAMGYHIVGVLGMDPSPSCGVNFSKGKGTMLGTDRDTSELPEAGVFIEELQNLLVEAQITDVPFFAIRRTLVGEGGLDAKLNVIKSFIQS